MKSIHPKYTFKYAALSVLVLILLVMAFAGCANDRPENTEQAEVPENIQLEPPVLENAPGDEGAPPLFSASLPAEFMTVLRGHELPVDDNPLIGTYETTSGCIMILFPTGLYIWQENQEVPVVTGIYEIFEGTVGLSGGDKDEFALESETGPLYTVIITFTDEHAAFNGTIQVFDFYGEGVFRVTDLINDFWFEATRIED